MANYQTGNFQYVVPTTYNPLSLQERLPIVMLYKDAYDKRRQEYIDLADKAGTFDYLRTELPEDSKARQIYENYANGFNEVAKDFSRNGLNLANGRDLLNYRRRYKSEIGRLEEANTAMEKEIDRRTALNANDPTMLYATDNFSIDDFLDKKKPSTYSVSGQKLYERGVQIGASDSSRIWSDPRVQQVNKYYQSIAQTTGRTPELLAEWRANLASIPELNDSLNATLKEFGATDNLTGNNLERAKDSVINGIINGSTYKRADNFQRDLSQMSAAESAEDNYRQGQLKIAQDELTLKQNAAKQDEWMYSHDSTGNRTGLSNAGMTYLGIVHPKSDSTKKDGTKTSKHTLRSGDYIEDGKVHRTPTGQQAGEEISYNEAVEADPSIAEYDPGYENHYRYYKNGSRITPIRKYTTVNENGEGVNEGSGGNSEDGNQI